MIDDKGQTGVADQLGIFAKYWQPGLVKTRLAATLGDKAASEVYRSFLVTLTARFSHLAGGRTVAYTPPNRLAEFSQLVGNRWSLVPQTEGDLGTRMQDFFNASFSNARRVVLIGSDSPTLPTENIRQAFRLLKQYSVVLGPATDGGYYLVGASGRVPPIFADVTWSCPHVWQQTVELLVKSNTPFAELPPWYDVDDIDDLRRLEREVKDLAGHDVVWSELASTVRRALEGVL